MADAEIGALADAYHQFIMDDAALWATMRGDLARIEAWEDFSEAGLARRLASFDGFAGRAEALGRSAAGMDRTLATSIAFDGRSMSVLLPARAQSYLVQGSSNLVSILANEVARYPLVTAAHGAGYVAKLRGLPDFLARWCDGVRAALATGHTPTARGVRD